MALDPEEFKKRRQARDQKRHSRKRSSIVRLVIALMILVVVGGLIFLLARPGNTPDPEETTPPEVVVRIAAAGDLNVTEKTVAAGGEAFDYTNTFLSVAPLLADADLTVLNFEGNLYGAPYGTDRSAPQNMMTALKNAGVDMLQLANSYSIYKGMHGLTQTLEGVRLAGMEPLGAYADAREAEASKGYTLRTVNGVKIAFVAFTKGMDGMALPKGNEGCVNLLYSDYASDYQSIDKEGINQILTAVQKEEPDITVALLHWGSEFNNNISQSQKDIRDLLYAGGVNAIIGTHSHYVQEMTLDENGRFIAYSLGDFFSDADRAGSEYSVILELEITKNTETGATRISNYSYTPIFTVAEEEQPLRVVQLNQAMEAYQNKSLTAVNEETYAAMEYALGRIEDRINPEKK